MQRLSSNLSRAARSAPKARLITRRPLSTGGSGSPHSLPTTSASSFRGSGKLFGVLAGGALLTSIFLTIQLRSPLALEASNAKILDGDDRRIEAVELAEHSTAESAWVVIDGTVWDVTKFLKNHPGGAQIILDNAGKDITGIFKQLHASGTLSKVESQLVKVGTAPEAIRNMLTIDDNEQDSAAFRRANLFSSDFVVNLRDFEQIAKEVLGEFSAAWTFFFSWADDGNTFNANRSAFSLVRFIPRVNIPIGEVDSTTTYFTSLSSVPFPIFMSPTGGSALAHPEGELNLTRASSKTQIPQCVSSVASKGIFEVLEERDRIVEMGGKKAPIWFQLYVNADRKLSEEILKKLGGAGGVEAILITVDTPVVGNREAHAWDAKRRAVKAGKAGKREEREYNMAPSMGASPFLDTQLSWSDIAWVKKFAPGVPVLVKGISAVEDVVLAKKHGADGVVLSNHGGRQLEYAPPPLATLVRLHREQGKLLKDPKFGVYIEGGITRGSDIIKAVALGAKGVGLGRTFLYAQACYGEEGVLRACEILASEVHRGMRLLGAKSINDLKPEMLEVLPGLVGTQEKSN